MRLLVIACLFSFGVAALALDDGGLASKVEAVKYPPLAKAARIQGDVHLHIGPKGVEFVSGHPLFAPVAVDNLKELRKVSEGEVIYHFVLVDDTATRLTIPTVQKSDALGLLGGCAT